LQARHEKILQSLSEQAGSPAYRVAAVDDCEPRKFVRLIETGCLPPTAIDDISELEALEVELRNVAK